MRLVLEHGAEYSTRTAAVLAVARQLGVGKESLRRSVLQAEVDGAGRSGVICEELTEIKKLKAATSELVERQRPPRRPAEGDPADAACLIGSTLREASTLVTVVVARTPMTTSSEMTVEISGTSALTVCA